MTLKKHSVVLVYTGDGKGKTSAALGLLCRALGHGSRVGYVQFIKSWRTAEDQFIDSIKPIYKDTLRTYKGGLGFYNAGPMSAANVSKEQHVQAAHAAYETALRWVASGELDLVICDEINNAVHDGLLRVADLRKLITARSARTSLCLTGRNFPASLTVKADIVSHVQKIKHHYDDGHTAMAGIDY